jgi:hypothetical protein
MFAVFRGGYIEGMWLEANHQYDLSRADPSQHVMPWMVDVMEFSDEADGLTPYVVGRILADELRPLEIAAWGDSVLSAADADSGGLLHAYSSLLDAEGKFRHGEFEAIGEPIVYMYRFELHDDFAACKLAVLDSFCRLFLNSAIVLAQYHTTWFTLAEFESVGFRPLGTIAESIESEASQIEESTRFMVRDNAMKTPFSFSDYPGDLMEATEEHEEWVESKGPWEGLC